LVEQRLLPPERVQILYSWKHSGFNVHAGEQVAPEAKADLEALAQYILRNPFSVEKMTLEWPADIVIYRSRLNAKINRNFEVFTATDFLATITQHIPDKGAGTAIRCAASATGACLRNWFRTARASHRRRR
jgi:Putative transposase